GCSTSASHLRVPACAPDALRLVAEGVMPPRTLKRGGPAAIRLIIARPDGAAVTERLHDGAFLYVALGDGGLTCKQVPTLTIRYADGTTSSQPLIPKQAL